MAEKSTTVEIDWLAFGLFLLMVCWGICWVVATYFEKAPKPTLNREQAWSVYQESK